MSVNTKLTNLANEIREISGTTTKKSLDVMISDISAANDLIDEQETLLNDLRDIVDSLPEAGGGSGEDLSAEVSEYANKIALLESAVASLETELANKASDGTGSGSLETCSLTLDFSAHLNAAAVFYHTLEDGEVVGKIASMNSDLPILTIEVLCNYYIVFDYKGYPIPGFTCENASGGPVMVGAGSKYKYKITAPNGGNAKITVYNND